MLDRNKLLLGAFGVRNGLANEDAMQDIVDLGADYIISLDATPEIVAMCEKFRMPMFPSNREPLWWGSDGERAGQFLQAMPPENMKKLPLCAESDMIVGDYLEDEPSSLDFKGIWQVFSEYSRLYPNKMPFLNLYPNYASVAENTGEQRINQLGNRTYREHIAQYIQEIDNDYLCMDFYPFQGECMRTYLDNLLVCAEACRDAHRDFWVIFQAGAWKPEQQIRADQVRWQCYLSLAFGARSLQAACYQHCWWDDSCCCVAEDGTRNEMYDFVRDAFTEMHDLGPAYMPFRYAQAYRSGPVETAYPLLRNEFAGLPDCGLTSDSALVVSVLEKQGENGTEKALMIVNCRDGEAVLTLPGNVKCVYRSGKPACESGEVGLAAGEGIFVTLK